MNPFSESKNGSQSAHHKRQREEVAQSHWYEQLGERWARALYSYYNWRTGSTSDLQFLIGLNLSIIFIGAGLRHFLIYRSLPSGATPTLGQDIYRVFLLLSFANGLPGPEDSPLERGFSLAISGSGLIAFALTVALVQQSVRGAIEANVKTGGNLFEIDHVVVLAWGESQRCIEMITQILEQTCLAYKATGGRAIAVLSARPKLEMEELFKSSIPVSRRYKSTLIFRQGSPLVPGDLKKVGAEWASSAIIVADSSRSPDEADAQSLRAAVLLDELDRPAGRRSQIVVEARTPNALRLLQAACSRRIIAVPTTQVTARRLARMVQHPAVADVSKALWSFASPSQVFLEKLPPLVGVPFGDLALRFADGTVLGLLNRRSGKCDIAPPADTLVGPHDDLVMMRPTGLAPGMYQPLAAPLAVSIGEWDPEKYERRKEAPTGIRVSRSSIEGDEEPLLNVTPSGEPPEERGGPLAWIGHQLGLANGDDQAQKGGSGGNGSAEMSPAGQQKGDGMYYIVSPEFTGGLGNREAVLICGWQDTPFMLELLSDLDRGNNKLPRGSEVTLMNLHPGEEIARHIKRLGRCRIAIRHIEANPLHRESFQKVDLGNVKCALVVCDNQWRDASSTEESNEEHLQAQDYLRLDSMILVVQLNIRTILEEQGRPDINIVCEKVAFQGLTRFEDRHSLPLGVSSNFTAYSAKLLTQVAVEPKALVVYSRMNGDCKLIVQDSSSLCAEGEQVSYATLQLRAQAVDQVLLGYREIPEREEAIVSVLNPSGPDVRSVPRVWNAGDNRIKLLTYQSSVNKEAARSKEKGVAEENATEKNALER
ncbi:hypothetical protein WJX75_009020 [Coccomyxa subellipsoidea]|uniref:Ion channel POLLUX n=1 Tax=Coccomyxa subellipsoidea TaxID=248742 RepID=A0ABR2YNM4_9CHLO